MRIIFLLLFVFAAAGAQETPPLETEGGAVETAPSQVINGSAPEPEFNEEDQVDVLDLYLDIDIEDETESTASTITITSTVTPPQAGGVQSTTPYSETIFVAPNTVSPDWDEARRHERNLVLAGERRGGALVQPSKGWFRKGVLFYPFSDGSKYLVFLTPNRASSIHLEPGEVVAQDPILTNSSVFSVRLLTQGDVEENKQQKQVLVLSARFAESDGSLVVVTNRRVYHFTLWSTSDFATEVIKFAWESPIPNPLESVVAGGAPAANDNPAAEEPPNAPLVARGEKPSFLRTIIPDELQFEFSFESPCDSGDVECSDFQRGQIEKLKPSYIYSDGEYTYFGWRRAKSPSRSPALFLEKNKELVPLSYTVKNSIFLVPSVFEEAVLMLNNDIFLIIRNENS